MTTDLPPGWIAAELGDLVNTKSGNSKLIKGKLSSSAEPGLVPAYSASGQDVWCDRAEWEVDGVVLSAVGARCGKSFLARGRWTAIANTHVLIPAPGIDTRWLWYLTNNEDFWVKGGSAQPFVKMKLSKRIPVSIPPLVEQRRIVAAIEEHFSRLDAVEVSLEVAELRCQALIKSILVGAIPNELPSCWRMTTVDGAGATGLGRQRSPKYHSGPNMKPYLRVANVFEDRIDASDVKEMHFDEADFDKYRLEVGDVLLNEGQSPEFLGRPAIYSGEPPNVAFTNSLIRFVPGLDVTPEWALLVFRRHVHSGRFMRESRITTNIAHLALGRFRSVEFPIPPLEVQDALVAATRTALASVDQIIEQIHSAAARTTAMRRSVLTQAFAGRLVPRNPYDDSPGGLRC